MIAHPHKPVGTRKQQQKDETRVLILETARFLFAEKGFEKTTIREIAARAGIGLGTIFNHFKGKDSLLAAALYEDVEKNLERAFNTLPEKASAPDQLLHIARSFYTYYARQPLLAKSYLKQVMFLDGEWGEVLDEQIRRFLESVASLLRKAQERGEVAPDTDCDIAATAFFSHYIFILITGLKQAEFRPDHAAEQLGYLLTPMFPETGPEDR
ncbi:TetR/AcrR family transcriptional regulator [Desulfonema ishimotonii]|uniref:TetR/AcrR family transcriptional regulator n=1 Tax=Desulfonema ishimotonii TaxID=45657 RepID=A0A401FZI7_9BACT|nr:TetR/AcrR family transcriptional regulator [Desulfonema ishimotonii]GBC62391.1 TetR/AcrR family transcriptional regulator [Desulfonema ishimotonii]